MLQGAKLSAKANTEGKEFEEVDLPEDIEDLVRSGSAKLDALVALLKQIPKSDKCLVFSSFVRCVGT